ncbi:cytochrome P450 [Ramaria rubella]|nr:cytochrome P450 [Ramaria rubella]
MSTITLVVSIGSLLCLYIATFHKRIPKGLRLPPGPPRKLISGNLANMPSHHPWETYTRWAKEYVFGTSIIILNSENVATDLFEKRSKSYSDRFDFPLLNDLLCFDWAITFMRYGNWWRRHRKMFHQGVQPTAAAMYNDIQTKQTRSYLRQLHKTPAAFVQHSRDLAGMMIMEPGDRHIETAEKSMTALAEAAIGAFLVDTIPICTYHQIPQLLKYVPEWMLGSGFKKWARTARVHVTAAADVPFAEVKGELEAGTANPSVLVTLLDRMNRQSNISPDEENLIRNVAAVAYLGAADTTVSAMNSFILAMLFSPETQKKAQAELDSVVGMDCLPEFSDRESLPYINALCQEVLRWNPVAPLGVAHRVTQDDVYGDYFIPEGSLVMGNSWGMLRDERTYGPEPEKFRPERFLNPGTKFLLPAFGYAINSIFIGIASVLKVFNITLAKDTNGYKILVEPSYTSGLISSLFPEPFECSIKP